MEDEVSSLQQMLETLRNGLSTCRSRRKQGKVYDMAPWEFLAFARDDLAEDSERGRVNALSNAKRAIDCRIDEILSLSYLSYFSAKNHWGLRYKIQVIRTLGLAAPDVLTRYIGDKRNLLEHEYVRPAENEEVRYIADIVELFLAATDPYTQAGFVKESTVELKTKLGEETHGRETVTTYHVEEFNLAFDGDVNAMTLKHKTFEEYHESGYSRAGSYSRSRVKHVAEANPLVVPFAECPLEQLRDLMALLWQKR